MTIHRSKSSTAAQTSAPEVGGLTATLRRFVKDHKHAGVLFPWEVGKQLDQISNAYGAGSGQFSEFMENLGNIKKGGIGIPEKTGYRYLRRYRDAVALFPQPVIDAMLAISLLPNKQKVIEGAQSDLDITGRLNSIREMPPKEAAAWSPSVVSLIQKAATRVKAEKETKHKRVMDAICNSFRLLLPETDPLYMKLYPKGRKEEPTPEQVTTNANMLVNACLDAWDRLQLAKYLAPDQRAATSARLSEYLPDREI